jgi:hypothetical protein
MHRRGWLAVFASAAMLASSLAEVGTATAGTGDRPELRLIRSTPEVTARRSKSGRVAFDPKVFLAVAGGAFEIEVSRPDYDTPMTAEQHVPGGGTVSLPPDVVGPFGFPRFFRVTVTDRDGVVRVDRLRPFCPNAWMKVRVGPEGPSQPVYPDYCSWNPFTLGMIYGIEQDWAASLSGGYRSISADLRAGRYAVDISLDPRYTDMFGVDPANAAVSLTLVVRNRRRHPHHERITRSASLRRPATRAPVQRAPDRSTLPDLVPLPSWGIGVHRMHRRDHLSFGANIWIKGNGPMVVEGFRREGERVMDAHQFFYRGGEPVGRAPVGELEYDDRKGHGHWHFRQFAGYQLLASDKTTVVVSTKESFCLVPTDAIDLTLPGADWRPWQVGLSSACGGRDDLWIREVLPLGWGDTYYQYLPGQSFDITDLPNGRYFIKVIANPGGQLFETSYANNASLREVFLRGRPGARRVVVPPWHGIDTEMMFGRYGLGPLAD